MGLGEVGQVEEEHLTYPDDSYGALFKINERLGLVKRPAAHDPFEHPVAGDELAW